MAAASPLVLVTGAAGFVGRQLLKALAERNTRLRIVIREEGQENVPRLSGVEAVIATRDLWSESASWFTEICRDVDTVIHAAWYAKPDEYLRSPKNLDCLSGTIRFAQGARAAQVRRFVGLGTCFEYDLDAGLLSIETALRPSTLYAGCKAAAFLALSQFLPQQAVEFVWARLFYLYGEGEDERRFVPYLRSRLKTSEAAELSSGTQIRDYLDVAEAGRMIVEAALGRVQGPINICSGQPVTIRQFAERIADEYGRRDLLRFGARPDNLVDPPRVVGIR